MILRNATIQYKGYDPEDLSHGSHKRICVSCDICGRVRYVEYCACRDLCHKCANHNPSIEHRQKISNSLKGKIVSTKTRMKMSDVAKQRTYTDKTRVKMSCTRQGISVNKFDGFIGKHPNRFHVLPETQCLKINKRFDGSHAHHIATDVIVYIPEKLHRHISHNIKTNQGMKEMNLLSLQFIKGAL